MRRFFIACMLSALLGTEVLAQCPAITIDAGSPHDTIASGCDDILKEGHWDLHQGQFQLECNTAGVGQCDGATQCWPAFYQPTITSRYFEAATQTNLCRHRVDGSQYSGCRLGLLHRYRADAFCQPPNPEDEGNARQKDFTGILQTIPARKPLRIKINAARLDSTGIFRAALAQIAHRQTQVTAGR